jgi:Domain of unknown function (DUF397)
MPARGPHRKTVTVSAPPRVNQACAVAPCTGSLGPMEETESRVEVYVTTDTSDAPHKAGEPKLYVMYDAAKPEAGKLYFTEAEWDAFVLGVRDGEFDLDENGNLPPVPADQQKPGQ